MIDLPEIAKSYRRSAVRRGFRAFVPAETPEAREQRLLVEIYQRENNEIMYQYKQYILDNAKRKIGLHDVDND